MIYSPEPILLVSTEKHPLKSALPEMMVRPSAVTISTIEYAGSSIHFIIPLSIIIDCWLSEITASMAVSSTFSNDTPSIDVPLYVNDVPLAVITMSSPEIVSSGFLLRRYVCFSPLVYHNITAFFFYALIPAVAYRRRNRNK